MVINPIFNTKMQSRYADTKDTKSILKINNSLVFFVTFVLSWVFLPSASSAPLRFVKIINYDIITQEVETMSNELTLEQVAEIEGHAKAIRSNIVAMVTEAQSGHPGGSLSATDILAT